MAEDKEVDQKEVQQVHAASLKLPDFWTANPQIWFLRLEAQFRSHRISSDSAKFDAVVGALNCEILSDITDILTSPPATGRYDAIKHRLIAIYADSETKTIQKLLSGLSLGDQKPSQLLHKMMTLNAGNKVDETVLRTLWLERLPHNLRPILSISSEDLQTVAIMGDKIHETVNSFAVAAVQDKTKTRDSEIQELRAEIAELHALIKDQKPYHRSRSSSRVRSRPKQQVSSSNAHNYCWYHHMFGDKAKKCSEPCLFKSEN